MKRGTWILLGIVAALAALVFLWERKLPSTDESEKAVHRMAPEWTKQAAALEREGFQPLALSLKSGEVWDFARPFTDRADGQSITGFLDLLAGTEVTRWVDGVPEAETGLKAPRATWTLSKADGARCTIALGAKAALGGGVYVRVDGRTALVPASVEESLLRPLDEFRYKELLTVGSADVTSFRLSEGGAVRLALQREGDNWSLSSPFADAADRYKTENLLDDWCACLVDSTVSDDAADRKPYGLDPPWREATLGTTRGEIVVRLGSPVPGADPKKNLRYVDVSGRPSVFAVSMNSLRSLDGDPEALRSMDLFRHDTYEAKSLTITGPATLTLQSDGQGRWTTASPPKGAKADDGAALFTAIGSLRGTKAFAAGAPEAASFSPYLTLTLKGDGWEETTTVGTEKDGVRLAKPAGRPVFLGLSEEAWKTAQSALDVASGNAPTSKEPAEVPTSSSAP